MKIIKQYPSHIAMCLLCLVVFPGLARAAVLCTGWGSDTTRIVSLGLPATVTIDSSGSLTPSSGSVSVPTLTCTDASSNTVVNSNLNWLAGKRYSADTREIAPGIGLKLTHNDSITGGALNAFDGTVSTAGLNWSRINWTLVYLPGTVATGTTTLAPTILNVLISDPSVPNGSRVLSLQPGISALTMTATCVLSVSNSGQINLPSADAVALTQTGYGSSGNFTAAVNCPSGVTLSSGTNLTLSTSAADSKDNTLVGNTGMATGVAIEVLDNAGKRVSATGGNVGQTSFTGSTSQAFSARIVHLRGQLISAGSVHGTATLTLKVN